jgi:PAS domain S-box-containing protein
MAQAFGEESSLSSSAEIEALRSIINSLGDGVIVADREGKFLFFNRVAQSILGIGSTQVSSEKWSEVYGCYRPDRITIFPSQELPLARALAGETVGETEIFIRNAERPAGVWIIAKASPLWDGAGALRGGVVVISDITKRKETEERIQTLTNAVEQTADSIVITDRNGLIQYVNPAFEQTTGFTRDDSLGRTPAILKSGVHDAAFYQELWSTILSGKVFRATIANRKKCGEIYFAEQTITPMRDSAGNITQFVTVVKDVTEQRKLQEHETQMRLARAVQQQFYTIAPPQIQGFDIAGAAFPAAETGGDYFDFVPLPKGCIGISIGDVCGHGISSALLMVELRTHLRAFSRKSLDVGEILTLVNSALVSDLEKGRYATLAFCRLHPPSRTIVYASAGHVPGYILDANGAVRHVLDSTDIPLGLFAERPFTSGEEIMLEPGEILALLTDGITEAEKPDRTQFGVGRALEFIRDHRQESAQQIVNGLYRTVRDFSDGLPQADDIAAIICKSLALHSPEKQGKSVTGTDLTGLEEAS